MAFFDTLDFSDVPNGQIHEIATCVLFLSCNKFLTNI